MSTVTPHNAFTPAREVQDLDRFAGRRELLDALSHALQSEGAQIVLYGQAGIGKSSLSRVLGQISMNEKAALNRLSEAPHIDFDYLPISVTCDDSITNIDKLCLRLLTDEEALAPWIPFKVVERSSSGEGGGKIGIKVIELSGKVSESITERASEIESNARTTFINACKAIVRSGVAKQGPLFIIDEFDRVPDKRGIASILKALGPDSITFALVGVAETISELIAEHQSVARQFSDGAVKVQPMGEEELSEVITRAMNALDNKYEFEESARDWIIKISRGHPFYVHLVGKHALLRAVSRGSNLITAEDAKEALAEIAFKGSAPVQEATYKKAVGHSYIRERILKEFAGIDEQEIYTTDIYSGLAKELGVDPSAVSVYVGQLAGEKYGPVITKTRERYYQFNDSLFKAYAAARPYERKAGENLDEAEG